ncbi:uncharacterized protein LOC132301687 [Cornus florida]|uniref:uncharacterized protein LOC132301687 n=1 Tax=Cornus florida TaxID=4283 RepID=UPI002897AA20|nr:uncharacterized protein LOC132301687 [Cornus florida]
MVEVDVQELLPNSLTVDIHGCDCTIDLEYEWKPTLCAVCKRLDHTEAQCPQKLLQTRQIKPKKKMERWVVPQSDISKVDSKEGVQKQKDNFQLVEVNNTNELTDEVVNSQEDNFSLEVYQEITPIIRANRRWARGGGSCWVNEERACRIQKKICPGWSWLANYSSNKLGKIWFGWNPVLFNVVLLKEDSQIMLLHVKHIMSGTIVYVSAVYAANKAADRMELWSSLRAHETTIAGPWIASGDWNMVMANHEKKGGKRVSQKLLEEYNGVIFDICMEEMPINNGEWSWYNKQKIQTMINAKLDRKKLGEVKIAIKEWNKRKGIMAEQVFAAREELHKVQMLMLNDPVNFELIQQEKEASCKYQNSLDLEEIMWAQKSRVQWLKEGDKCTAFFHNVVKQRRSNNAITALKNTTGELSSDSNTIKEWLVNFYTDLYNENGATNAEVINPRKQISQEDSCAIDQCFTTEEIKNVTMQFKPDKAPGPDGFPTRFFQKFWEIVGQDVVNGVLHFFNNGNLPKGVNSTFLTLIPKSNHGDKIANYRPITLCNITYKIISKLLAYRLSSVLPNLIGPEQSAFIKNRRLHDNFLLVNDLVKGFGRKKGDPSVALKIAIKKALQSHGFSEKWITWTMGRITTANFSVLCNGVPADDLVMVVKAEVASIKAIADILTLFRSSSGLQVNKEKSSIIFSKAVRGRRRLSRILKFQVEQFPFKHLGLPLSNNILRTGDYRILLDKVDARFLGKLKICWRKDVSNFYGVVNKTPRRWLSLSGVKSLFLLKRVVSMSERLEILILQQSCLEISGAPRDVVGQCEILDWGWHSVHVVDRPLTGQSLL